MKQAPMLVLFTDFGPGDPYVGQVHGVLAASAPGVPVVDLLHRAPAWDVMSGAYLLAALAAPFPAAAVFLAVVDPGVGGERAPIMLHADGRWYVGPDNGLFELVMRRAERTAAYRILWQPEQLSASFHGRDLFAPVAAMLAAGRRPEHRAFEPLRRADWPDDLARVVYTDHFGNVFTGIRGSMLDSARMVAVAGRRLPYRRVFSEAREGEPFWYVNSSGLVELSLRGGSAAELLELQIGDAIEVLPGSAARSP